MLHKRLVVRLLYLVAVFLHLVRTAAEVVKKTVDFAQAVPHMKIPFQIVHGLQLTTGIKQTADDHVSEHVAGNIAVAYPIIKPSKHQFRTDDLYLCIVQMSNEALKANFFLVYARQKRLMVT